MKTKVWTYNYRFSNFDSLIKDVVEIFMIFTSIKFKIYIEDCKK